MSHYPHFPSFEYNFCEGLVELNRQLELAQSEKQSVTERDLLSLEGGLTANSLMASHFSIFPWMVQVNHSLAHFIGVVMN